MTDSLREDLRNAVAESFDYAMDGAVFEAADNIADAILDDEQTDAAEIADGLVETYTSDLLNQWTGLGAHGAAEADSFVAPGTDALVIIQADVYCVLFNAASAALDAYECAAV